MLDKVFSKNWGDEENQKKMAEVWIPRKKAKFRSVVEAFIEKFVRRSKEGGGYCVLSGEM